MVEFLEPILIAGCLMLTASGLEHFIPTRIFNSDGDSARFNANIALFLSNEIFIYFLQPLVAAYLVRIIDFGKHPIMRHDELPLVAWCLLLILVFELVLYWQHRLFHEIPALWRLHSVHHSDIHMDATTSFRHHPIEAILGIPFFLPIFLALQPPLAALTIAGLYQVGMAVFAHTNISLPSKLGNRLSLWLVTPNYHRVHHMADVQRANSNYAHGLSIIDWVFGTQTKIKKEEQVSFPLGLEYLPKDSLPLTTLLSLPFKPRERK